MPKYTVVLNNSDELTVHADSFINDDSTGSLVFLRNTGDHARPRMPVAVFARDGWRGMWEEGAVD